MLLVDLILLKQLKFYKIFKNKNNKGFLKQQDNLLEKPVKNKLFFQV